MSQVSGPITEESEPASCAQRPKDFADIPPAQFKGFQAFSKDFKGILHAERSAQSKKQLTAPSRAGVS
jgi:hypothetical protein